MTGLHANRCQGLLPIDCSHSQEGTQDAGRRGAQLRSCPPPCGLLLYLTALSATPPCVGQHGWLPLLLGWMVQRSQGGEPGAARFGGHERNHPPQWQRPPQNCASKVCFRCTAALQNPNTHQAQCDSNIDNSRYPFNSYQRTFHKGRSPIRHTKPGPTHPPPPPAATPAPNSPHPPHCAPQSSRPSSPYRSWPQTGLGPGCRWCRTPRGRTRCIQNGGAGCAVAVGQVDHAHRLAGQFMGGEQLHQAARLHISLQQNRRLQRYAQAVQCGHPQRLPLADLHAVEQIHFLLNFLPRTCPPPRRAACLLLL